MHIRDPVNTELVYRPELTPDEQALLIEWAVGKKYQGRIIVRGADPEFPGSTFWELQARLRITIWPQEQRVWATHCRDPGENAARIMRFLEHVLTTHPPTRH